MLYNKTNCDPIKSSRMPIQSTYILRRDYFIRTHKRTKGWLCKPSHNHTITYKPFVLRVLFRSRNVDLLVSRCLCARCTILSIEPNCSIRKSPRGRHPTFRCTLSTPNVRSVGPNTAGCLILVINTNTNYYISFLYSTTPILISNRRRTLKLN